MEFRSRSAMVAARPGAATPRTTTSSITPAPTAASVHASRKSRLLILQLQRTHLSVPQPVVLIPSWEQPVAGNLSDKLGAFWELVIGSDASARSLGIGWEPGSQKSSLGALKLLVRQKSIRV